MAQKGNARWATLLLVSFVVHGAIIVNNTESALWNAQSREGELLAQQIADAAAPLMLSRDRVSLSILTSQYEQHSEIGSIRLFNHQQELVSESLENHRHGRTFTTPIRLQQQNLGHLELRLASPAMNAIVRHSAGNIGLSALFHLIIFIAGIFLVSANRGTQTPATRPTPSRTASTPTLETQPAPEQTPPPAAVEAPTQPVTLLYLALDDPKQLLARVNPKMADEMLTFFDQLVDRVAQIYGGSVDEPFSLEGIVIRFEQRDNQTREFHAIAAASLFMQLTQEATEQRQQHQLLCLNTKAGILHSTQAHPSLATITQRIAELAPACRILGSRPSTSLQGYCQFGHAFTVNLTEQDSLSVLLVESLAPEYVQLIQNQSRQILQLDDA